MHSARAAAALLTLLLMLLGMQWTGMQHRIEHAWISSSSADHASASDDDEAPDLAHSCTLFDAAALGATLHSAFFRPVCPRAVMSTARSRQTSPPHAHPFRHFSPRGPPLF
ncbi:hypothetical protein RY831_11575 [Noviherbaspirillum sp. CPCC 100848]|uniref:Secreted protein n=1 Tax=Noviherbaspirillum album TaxID=3080276 RepID=A0ABU6J827_9BURK|nr:hypothetical protein [Noviherbaspirillum sp. CPCC 100848]MEC4719791.1 hypothetical protein [Noviherbaspirillum sp. CPCC 100848]